jgi:LuxR family maltose regulon positive regulatory protein
MSKTVLVVDDHPVFRKGLRLLLEQEEDLCDVVEAGGGQEALVLAREFSPDVIVMDITMPDLDGIEATRLILSEFPSVKVIALSIHGGRHFVENMLRAGASGYVLKDSVPEELVAGVRAVLNGEIYLSAEVTDLVVSQYVNLLSRVQVSGWNGNLTKREVEMLLLIAEGDHPEQIASEMKMDLDQTTAMQQQLICKLGVSGLMELTEYASARKWFLGEGDVETALQHSLGSVMEGRSLRGNAGDPEKRAVIESLTCREGDTLQCLQRRLYNKEIAEELSISVETVKTHLKNIFQKLGVNNRRDAIEKARSLGLFPPEANG